MCSAGSLTITAPAVCCVIRKSMKMSFVTITQWSVKEACSALSLTWGIARNPRLHFLLTPEPRFCSRSPQDVTYILDDRGLDPKLLAIMSSLLHPHPHPRICIIGPEQRIQLRHRPGFEPYALFSTLPDFITSCHSQRPLKKINLPSFDAKTVFREGK